MKLTFVESGWMWLNFILASSECFSHSTWNLEDHLRCCFLQHNTRSSDLWEDYFQTISCFQLLKWQIQFLKASFWWFASCALSNPYWQYSKYGRQKRILYSSRFLECCSTSHFWLFHSLSHFISLWRKGKTPCLYR